MDARFVSTSRSHSVPTLQHQVSIWASRIQEAVAMAAVAALAATTEVAAAEAVEPAMAPTHLIEAECIIHIRQEEEDTIHHMQQLCLQLIMADVEPLDHVQHHQESTTTKYEKHTNNLIKLKYNIIVFSSNS